MSSWFKDVARPAMLDALVGVCDQIQGDFGTEIKSYEKQIAELGAELETSKANTSKLQTLEEENKRLKLENEELKKNHISKKHPLDTSGSSRTPLAARSVNEGPSPRRLGRPEGRDANTGQYLETNQKYAKLEAKYEKLYEKYLELQDAHNESTRLLRDRTDAYHQWKDHAMQLNEQSQSRSRRIKKLEARLAEATEVNLVDSSFSSNNSLTIGGGPQEARNRDLVRSAAPDRLAIARRGPTAGCSPLTWPPVLSLRDEHQDSVTDNTTAVSSDAAGEKSQNRRAGSSTPEPEDESFHPREEPLLPRLPEASESSVRVVGIKDEPSSDTPVVVSERCVHKRKHPDTEKGVLRSLAKVKSEPSPEPLFVDERRHLAPEESMDFDAERHRVETPRKRTKYLHFHENNTVSSAPAAIRPQERIPQAYESNGDVTKAAYGGDSSDGPLRDENSVSAHVRERVDSNLGVLETGRSSGANNIDPDTGVLRRPRPSRAYRQRTLSPLTYGLASLAEDGDQYQDADTRIDKRPGKGHVLRGLSESPTHADEPTVFSSSLYDKSASTLKPLHFPVPEKRTPLFGKSGTRKVTDALQTSSSPVMPTKKGTSSAINPKRKSYGAADDAMPLRERPKSHLRLEDFKINPDVNDGYDYAYTDVVRGKDDRASLSGCLNDACCGPIFRAHARAARDATGAIAFTSLLETYLGDEAYKLCSMSKREKEELWVEAKARELADAQGRHRHKHPRMASPPGFWRTDFPSTQEGKQDKEEAAKMVCKIIEERYREAMRPGGKWVFRDE